MARLEAELQAQGKKLDELGASRTTQVLRDVLAACARAESPEKRDALINAAVRQFDPRAGTASTRAYWLRVLASVSDVELHVVRIVVRHSRVSFLRDGIRLWEEPPPPLIRLTLEDATTFAEVAGNLASPIGGGDKRMLQMNNAASNSGSSYYFEPLDRARVLVEFTGPLD